MVLSRIVSGGQTGVDRGALTAAIDCGVAHGGWCPRGRRSEAGRIPGCYQLQETESSEYAERTERNVRDSDGTMILYRGALRGGTKLTQRLARRVGKPCLVVDLDQPPPLPQIVDWLIQNRIEVLNVAGPRESQSPGIEHDARTFVRQLLRALA